ncbi:MAG: diguanylate cyclase [Myxococcales bacterium]|jgi:diguanylate cyclase (GGDEF)-like protein|nr:diguanylate cyclase [Myxococcales bacterium]
MIQSAAITSPPKAIASTPELPRILAVDDQPANLITLGAILETMPVEFQTAPSGPTALARILERDYDLVLLDVQMPDMNGFETAKLIRSSHRTRHIPFIFITALNTDAHFIRKGYELGAIDYITKPIDPAVLRSKINVFLQLHTSNSALREEVAGLKNQEERLRKANKDLRHQAQTDPLTGLLNRRHGHTLLCREMSRVERGNQDLSIIMADIDHFKNINDTHGHPAGDAVLLEIARRLTQSFRPHDLVVRWGGEEFLIICPHTSFAQSLPLAQRIHHAIRDVPIDLPSGLAIRVTISMGLAHTSTLRGLSAEGLLAQADDALYAAKRDGRDRIRVAQV